MLLFSAAFLVKPLLTSALELNWDADIEIGRVGIDAANKVFVMDSIRVGNPYGFPKADMLMISRVEVALAGIQYEKRALIPQSLKIHIDKVELMRRVSGHLNLESLLNFVPEKKKKGFRITPLVSRFFVEQLSESDATGPLLQKKEFKLQNKEIVIERKKSFRDICRAGAEILLKSIEPPQDAVVLPAPEYKGIVSDVEESLREQAQKISEDNEEFVPSESVAGLSATADAAVNLKSS